MLTMDHLYCHSSSSDSSNSVVYHLQNNHHHHHPAGGPPISATNSNNFIIMTAANQTSTQAAAVAAATTSSSIQPQLASASSVNSANHHHHNQRYSSGGGLIISGGSVGSGVDNPSVDATPATAFNKQLKSMLLLNLDLIQEQSDMLLAKDKQITALKQENDLLKVKLERLERRILRSQNTLSPQLQQQQQQQQHQSSAYAITSPGQKQLSQQQQPQKQTGDNLRLVQANGENLVPVKSESDSDVEEEDEEDEEGQQLQCLVDDKLNVISPKLVPEYVNNSCSSSGSASNNKVPVVEQHHHHQVAASETESTPVKMPPSGNRNSIKADHPQNKGTIKSYLTSLRPKASTASSTPASSSPTNSSSSINNNNNNNSTLVTLQSTKSNGYSIKSRASPYKRDENSLPKVANNSNNKLKNCTTPDTNAVPITRHFARVSPPNRQQPSAAAAAASEVTAKADRHVQLDDNVLVLKIQPTTDDDDDDDPEDEVDNASGSDEHVKRELKVQPLAVDDENDSSEKTIAGTANYDNNNSAVKQKRSETVANNCGAKVMLKRHDAVVNASTSGGVGTTAMKRRSTTSESSSSVYTYRRGRKLARSMYTHKLYVTRHWEEVEQEEDPNSLAVAELKRNCNNNNNTNNNNSDADACGSLEVPSWRIVDGTISDDNDVESMDVDEDMSADAYLKRHSKYELDERRRKKWDVQRIREQRTIERLKRRQCKSEGIHLPDDDAATATGSGLNPMSLYPNASDIKYVETTEELPIQAFGEPVPNFAPFEFEPAWRDAARPSPRDNSKEENTTNGCSTSGGGSQIEFCPLAKYSTFALRRAQQLFVASSNAVLANAGCSSAGSASGGGGGAGGGSTTTCRPFKFKRFKTKKK